MNLKCNCCDGIYNSFDVHFTSACDNLCSHCIDTHFNGIGINRPDVDAITKTIIDNAVGVDDVLFLGGEPCLYIDELLHCVAQIRKKTNLKIFVTTSMPMVCHNKFGVFEKLIQTVDGMNISVQHHDESIADKIRNTKSLYDRQCFYKNLPQKEKIRINLNIVKPFLHEKDDLIECLIHYGEMGFNSIKLSEIQHGDDFFVSFEETFGIKMLSPYSHGCQTYLDMRSIIKWFKTPVLLKRSCFLCEKTLKASIGDAVKVVSKLFLKPRNKYGVIYENGLLSKGWI